MRLAAAFNTVFTSSLSAAFLALPWGAFGVFVYVVFFASTHFFVEASLASFWSEVIARLFLVCCSAASASDSEGSGVSVVWAELTHFLFFFCSDRSYWVLRTPFAFSVADRESEEIDELIFKNKGGLENLGWQRRM